VKCKVSQLSEDLMSTSESYRLVGLTYSPWTHKARWALEYCGIDYRYSEYIPRLGEPALRFGTRQWSGVASVPVLFGAGNPISGAFEIARYANRLASGGLGDFEQLEEWNDLSDAALAEGRARVLAATLSDPLALEESLAGLVPAPLRRTLRFLARDSVRGLSSKYAHTVTPGAMTRALERTRAQLSRSSSDYLLGSFTYADIAMIAVLEMVEPLARTTPPRGPATLRCWTAPALASQWSDLLRWRERVLAASGGGYSQYALALAS
jgi:glutathione S-transferase